MKRLWGITALSTILLYATPAAAQMAASGPYIGGAIGGATVKLDLNEINLIDDTALAWKVLAGYRWKNFAIEADYRAMEKLTAVFPGSDVTSRTRGFQGSALLFLPVGPVDFFGRAGAFRWTLETGLANVIEETTGTDFAYGGGIALRIGSASLRAEYERSQIEGLTNPHMITAGVTLAF